VEPRNEQTGWKLIDPRGMSGETAYDVAVLAIRVARFQPTPNIASLIANAAGLDPKRVSAWMTVADAARV